MARADRILLEGMLFFGRHGVSPEEKALGQQYQVDVEVEADLSAARASDTLQDTIDYRELYATVKAVIEGPSRNLLERLADEIASRVLAQFSLRAVRVRVQKPRLPLGRGVALGASVEVYQESRQRLSND